MTVDLALPASRSRCRAAGRVLKRYAEGKPVAEPALCALPHALAQAFAISGFDRVLRIYRTEAEARSPVAG